MTYNIIGTGSSGNAVMLGEHILIDCGVSWKQLAPLAKDIRLVLLTHQHGDHFKAKTVARLADERPMIRWCCCKWMVPLLMDAGVDGSKIDIASPGFSLRYDNLAVVRPEEVMHDVPNCCWHIDINGYKVFYVTDAGHLQGITAKDYDLYLIEANHTREEIKRRAEEKAARGQYSYEYRAAQNHLSFEQANDWLVNNAADYSRICYLHQHRDKGGA